MNNKYFTNLSLVPNLALYSLIQKHKMYYQIMMDG